MHSGLKPTFNCIWLVYDAQGASEVICLGIQGIDYKDKMLKVICGVIIFFLIKWNHCHREKYGVLLNTEKKREHQK